MKKVLILSLAYHPFVGGAEVAIKEITDRIPEKDIMFHMVTLCFDSTLPRVEQVGNVLVHRIGFARKKPTLKDLKRFPLHLNKLYYQIGAFFHAIRLHRAYRYDALWAMMAHSTGVPASLFKIFNKNVAYLLTLQEGDSIRHIKRTMLPLYPFFVRSFTQADRIQTISTYLAKWAVEMGFRGTPIVIPNGVDVKRFSKEYPYRELEALKQELRKKMDSIFLITTSRLVKKNGIDTVIRALSKLPQHVSFVILGAGPEEARLKELALEEGVMSRVRFVGEVHQKDIPKYLKVSDIFIRPSRSEGMGNSFVEAMAAGIPIIGTQEGGISDFLFDPDKNPSVKPTGLAVNVDDPEGVIRAVSRYSSNMQLRREIVENARALAQARYDWGKIVSAMESKFFKMNSKF